MECVSFFSFHSPTFSYFVTSSISPPVLLSTAHVLFKISTSPSTVPSWRQLTATPSASAEAVDAHEFGALNTLGLCVVLGLCVLAGYWLKQRKFYYLPESAAIMLIGTLTGGLVEWLYPSGDELSFLRFNPQMFFFVLLPPIIFEAGYKLNKKGFFSNFTTIILFAVFGTLVSTFVIGGLLYGFAELGAVKLENHTPIEALLFGALISAVDPVATLAIMGAKEVNCDPLLYSLIFGESVLNDAVAIVLFHTLQGFEKLDKTFDVSTVFSVLGQFLGVSIGSILIGVICGLMCCSLMKYSALHKYPKYEITILFLTAFGSFSLSESIEWQGGGLSGIMSLFFCGITLSHYNYYNLSEASQVSSSFVFETMASLSETIVFAYIGTSVFSSKHMWDFRLIFLSILFCAGARALNTFPFSACANIKRKKKIPMKMQIVIWFAGLRGAIAFALAMTLTTPNAGYIITTTLCIVIFTTVVCGGTTEPRELIWGNRPLILNCCVLCFVCFFSHLFVYVCVDSGFASFRLLFVCFSPQTQSCAKWVCNAPNQEPVPILDQIHWRKIC